MILERLKQNWKSGLTTSLVSIPLSISLAVASKTTPTVGIITAVWAGLAASFFGGSKYNIIGPTGALSGMLAVFAIQYGSDALAMVALVTGVMVLIFYALRIERFLVFVPASTIHGFTLGVAFIIAFNQLNYALGISGLATKEKFVENIYETFKHINQTNFFALAVFVAFLLLLFILKRLTSKISGAVILSPFGILLGYLASVGTVPYTLHTLETKFGNISSQLFIMPRLYFDSSLITAGAVIALIAIMETMISAKIADGMTKTKHDKRKEIFGLGIANLFSGAMGGMPATAALARTSVNIKAGATDKMSATINSIVIAVISILLIKYFKYMPLAVIAAILVFIAVKMVEAEHFKRLFRTDKTSFFIALLVAFITIVEDPIMGILVGICISVLMFMDKISRGQFELIINNSNKKITGRVVGDRVDGDEINLKGHTLVYSINGQLAYINSQSHISRFEQDISGFKNVVLRLRSLYFIDVDGVDALDEIIELVHRNKGNVYITGINNLIEGMLLESNQYKKLKDAGHVLESTSEALTKLGFNLKAKQDEKISTLN